MVTSDQQDVWWSVFRTNPSRSFDRLVGIPGHRKDRTENPSVSQSVCLKIGGAGGHVLSPSGTLWRGLVICHIPRAPRGGRLPVFEEASGCPLPASASSPVQAPLVRSVVASPKGGRARQLPVPVNVALLGERAFAAAIKCRILTETILACGLSPMTSVAIRRGKTQREETRVDPSTRRGWPGASGGARPRTPACPPSGLQTPTEWTSVGLSHQQCGHMCRQSQKNAALPRDSKVSAPWTRHVRADVCGGCQGELAQTSCGAAWWSVQTRLKNEKESGHTCGSPGEDAHPQTGWTHPTRWPRPSCSPDSLHLTPRVHESLCCPWT